MAVKKDWDGEEVDDEERVGSALEERDGDAPDRMGVRDREPVADAVDTLEGTCDGAGAPLLVAQLPFTAAVAIAWEIPTPVLMAEVGATGTVTALTRLTSDTICTSASVSCDWPPAIHAIAARSRAALLTSVAMPAAEDELDDPPAAYSVRVSDMPKGASGVVPATGLADGLREDVAGGEDVSELDRVLLAVAELDTVGVPVAVALAVAEGDEPVDNVAVAEPLKLALAEPLLAPLAEGEAAEDGLAPAREEDPLRETAVALAAEEPLRETVAEGDRLAVTVRVRLAAAEAPVDRDAVAVLVVLAVTLPVAGGQGAIAGGGAAQAI